MSLNWDLSQSRDGIGFCDGLLMLGRGKVSCRDPGTDILIFATHFINSISLSHQVFLIFEGFPPDPARNDTEIQWTRDMKGIQLSPENFTGWCYCDGPLCDRKLNNVNRLLSALPLWPVSCARMIRQSLQLVMWLGSVLRPGWNILWHNKHNYFI